MMDTLTDVYLVYRLWVDISDSRSHDSLFFMNIDGMIDFLGALLAELACDFLLFSMMDDLDVVFYYAFFFFSLLTFLAFIQFL